METAHPLVMIEWLDSHSGDGWQSLDHLASMARPVHCRSVGWLVAERDGMKVLVAHVSGEDDEGIRAYGTGDIAIPEAAILKMRTLAAN